MIMKRKIVVLLALVMAGCMLISACGGGNDSDTKADPQNSTTAGTKAADKETTADNKQKDEVKGAALVDYKDKEFGYTMLVPDSSADDVDEGVDSGCTVWIFKDVKADERVLMLAASEYSETSPRFKAAPDAFSSADQLLDLFGNQMDKVLGNKLRLSASKIEASMFTYDKVSVNGLDGAKFKGTIQCNDEKNDRDYGFAGVCVMGEKRPYVFWAIDLTEDMSQIDKGLEIINACLKDFKEGN